MSIVPVAQDRVKTLHLSNGPQVIVLRAARELGRFVSLGLLALDDARAAGLAIAEDVGLDAEFARAAVSWGLAAGGEAVVRRWSR